MPSYGDDAQPAYYQPMPVQAPYVHDPVQPYGQRPLPQPTMVYPPSSGIDGVTVIPDQYGRPVAYYSQSAPSPSEPLISPLMAKMALAAFILAAGGVGIYFLAMALATLIAALTMLIAVVAGGAAVIAVLSAVSRAGRSSGTRVSVNARGRANVQIHTGRGHNRGRR
ncbi:phage holin family protein [Streptomyces sp. NPDC008079]|uniref:phage holin family protein n=1 Tax=Streptomyces sp. NPDC008079 TaxID=3364806 RepID=UPI0036F11704